MHGCGWDSGAARAHACQRRLALRARRRWPDGVGAARPGGRPWQPGHCLALRARRRRRAGRRWRWRKGRWQGRRRRGWRRWRRRRGRRRGVRWGGRRRRQGWRWRWQRGRGRRPGSGFGEGEGVAQVRGGVRAQAVARVVLPYAALEKAGLALAMVGVRVRRWGWSPGWARGRFLVRG